MWPVRLEDKVLDMAVVEHMKIVYFPSLIVVEDIMDAYQIRKGLGVQLKLIQKAKCKYGLDVTITAEKIMVNINDVFLFIYFITQLQYLLILQALTHMWFVRLEVKEMAMELVEHLRIVNFPLHIMVKDIMDVQLQIKMAPGVPQKLILKAIWRNGPDATTTAKKIVVSLYSSYYTLQGVKILLKFRLHTSALHKL